MATPESAAKASSKQTLVKAAAKGEQAAARWSKDVEWYMRYVALVAENNPGRADKVAARPDVKHALKEAADKAGKKLHAEVDKSWAQGTSLGRAHAKKELKALGVTATAPFTDKPDLFHADVDRLMKDFVEQTLERVKEGKDPRSKKFSLRARLISEGALKDAEQRAKGSLIDAAGMYVKWVSRLLPTTCDRCKHLHGQVVKYGEPFKEQSDIGIKVHGGGPCLSPPRHPWCWCYLVAVKKGK